MLSYNSVYQMKGRKMNFLRSIFFVALFVGIAAIAAGLIYIGKPPLACIIGGVVAEGLTILAVRTWANRRDYKLEVESLGGK